MNAKERIVELMKAKHLKPAQFERLCGLSNGYVKGVRESVGIEKLEQILRTFPDVNREWLMFGTGSMFVDGAVSNVNAQSNSTQVNSNNQNSNIVGDTQNEKLLDLLSQSLQENSAQRQQMDRMITILERLTQKDND